MKERPILFSAPMVRAILDGRKTQTRRIVKFNHKPWLDPLPCVEYARDGMPIWWSNPPDDSIRNSDYYDTGYPCPYGKAVDRLWVKEALRRHNNYAVYDADYPEVTTPVYDPDEDNAIALRWKWKRDYQPAMFMPRHASRITLEVASVRVERLQDITEEDAIAEGAQCAGVPASLTNRGAFAKLWESINGQDSWKASPWVWVIEFRRIET